MDITPTILELAGVSHPDTFEDHKVAGIQGKSLLPVLDASRDMIRGPKDWLGGELFGSRFVRQGKWKLLWICEPNGPGKWQLYDVEADPGEVTDLADRNSEIRDRLVEYWAESVERNHVILPDTSPICTKSN